MSSVVHLNRFLGLNKILVSAVFCVLLSPHIPVFASESTVETSHDMSSSCSRLLRKKPVTELEERWTMTVEGHKYAFDQRRTQSFADVLFGYQTALIAEERLDGLPARLTKHLKGKVRLYVNNYAKDSRGRLIDLIGYLGSFTPGSNDSPDTIVSDGHLNFLWVSNKIWSSPIRGLRLPDTDFLPGLTEFLSSGQASDGTVLGIEPGPMSANARGITPPVSAALVPMSDLVQSERMMDAISERLEHHAERLPYFRSVSRLGENEEVTPVRVQVEDGGPLSIAICPGGLENASAVLVTGAIDSRPGEPGMVLTICLPRVN